MATRVEVRQDVYDRMSNEDLVFSAVVSQSTSSGYDPDTGSKTEVTTDNDGYVLFKRISERKSIPKYYEIRGGDKACLFAGNGFEPLVKDVVLIDGKSYNIQLSIDNSAGSKALFYLIIR